MNQKIMTSILQKYDFQHFQINHQKDKIEIENHHYLISMIFYHQMIVEEMIYDKCQKEICFYFHHACFNETHTMHYIQEFLDIASEMTSDLLDLKDYKH